MGAFQRGLTVRQLIERLKELPADAKVYSDSNEGREEIEASQVYAKPSRENPGEFIVVIEVE